MPKLKMYSNGDATYKQSWFLYRTFYTWHFWFADELGWKKELFKFPFGYYFRNVGGEPLDRSGGLNKVDSIASIFERKEVFRLAVAPEGTRKAVNEIKTGFYFIALKAKVPIVPVAFDWGKKEVNFGKPFFPTGNYEADFEILKKHYEGVLGKIPENGVKL